jgi:hypothetical protein
MKYGTERTGLTNMVAGVIVAVSFLVPGTLRKELQKVVAGGPSFLRTLMASLIFEQSMAR